ncbi:MAG: nucleotide exchange factor GrpE [Prevotellaceae bacterium]|jgi:molecular chaperone GrpE (heat shock protein)|nr:nucleotide exchange factor GrpE [Prevotellaceae bacterium]
MEEEKQVIPQAQVLEELIGKVSPEKQELVISLLKAITEEEAAVYGRPAYPVVVDLPELKNLVAGQQSLVAGQQTLADGQQTLTTEQQTLTAEVKKMLEEVEVFAYKDKINKELHEELQKYKGGLRDEFISPLLKRIMREYDRVIGQYRFYLRKTEAEPQNEAYMKLLREFDMMAESLLYLLEDYNLEVYDPAPGSDYVPKTYKIIKVIETDDPALGGKVAQAIACGFRDTESERIIRPAEIALYKYKEPINESIINPPIN